MLVSGIAFRGNEHRILLASFRAPHEFVVSQDVQDEAKKGLQQKFAHLRADASEAISLIIAEVVLRHTYERALGQMPTLRDPKDAHVLAAAVASACDILVTGDKDLLAVREIGKLQVVKPATALRILGI